jgi:hypothetical protein
MGDLRRDEFENWMHVLRDDIHGVHDRLDALNGRTRTNEKDIAVLQDRATQESKDPTARYGALGGIVAATGGILYHWFKG